MIRALLVLLGVLISWAKGKLGKRLVAPAASDDSNTEFTCQVVKITQLLPHGNADKLEIAKFQLDPGDESETAYEVVVRKGDYSVGSLAGYLSVDCVVPTARPEFSFLKERIDGAGKDHYRIRAARLRGVFSQGLMVPVDATHKHGDKLADKLGVTYHSTEEPTTYQHGTGQKHVPSLPVPVYGVTSLKKDPGLLRPGEDVIITEKIHGCCMEFGWIPRKILGIRIGYKFIVGSHRQLKKGDESEADVWMETARRMDLATKTRGQPGLVFYGEVYGYGYTGKELQDLHYGCTPESGPGLRVFDVLRVTPQRWLAPEDRAFAVLVAGLASVPVLYRGPLEGGIIGKICEGKSTLDDKTLREGVVVEATDGSHRKGKFVSQGYLLRKAA